MKRLAGAIALAIVLGAAACGDGGKDDASDASRTTTTTESDASTTTAADGDDVYADGASWLCRPDRDDACEHDMDATVVNADGTTSPDPFHAATDAPVDCFYVYPTVSNDPGANSEMAVGPEEENVVRRQAARFGSVCAMYAPMYRQATLTALRALVTTGSNDFFAAYADAYDDVRAAWRHYLAEDNHGRGVILIGHSQGASHALKLLEEEIDPDPAQRKLLVSAMVFGTSAHESDLPHVPPCRSNAQTGCIITYSTFRDTAPPPPNAYFARPKGSEPAICTNPAALAGGSGTLTGYFASGGWGVDVATPFVQLPGLVTGECRNTGGIDHLAITVHADPGPRVDDIRGDGLSPEWGMHTIDMSVAQGNLVEVARAEAAAYSSG